MGSLPLNTTQTCRSPSHTDIIEPSMSPSAWASACLRAVSLFICFWASSMTGSLPCLIASYATGPYLTPSLTTLVSAFALPGIGALPFERMFFQPNVGVMTEPPHALSLDERRRLAMSGVERNLMGRHPVSPQEELRSIIAELDELDGPGDSSWDRYGDGGPVTALESRVATVLGKPAAVMFPSGTMAQQSTLRVWSDRLGSRRIAIPALSHLLHHEQDGPRLLNGFEWALLTTGVTTGGVVPTIDHLAAIPGELGAALLELPLRDGGYLLPSWKGLEAFSRACSDRGAR